MNDQVLDTIEKHLTQVLKSKVRYELRKFLKTNVIFDENGNTSEITANDIEWDLSLNLKLIQ